MERSSRAILPIVFTTILLDFMGFSVLFPVLPLLADRLGASPFQVGLIITLYAMSQLVLLPAWGWLSDRFGRRPIMLISLAGTVVAHALLVVADSLALIYAARLLGGACAANIATAQAIVTDVTPPEERARGMGFVGAAFGLGLVVGPFVGGELGAIHERLPFIATTTFALANFVAAAIRLPETRRGLERRRDWRGLARALVPAPIRIATIEHGTELRLLLYLYFHLFTAFAALEAMFTLYLAHRFELDERAAGRIFAWIGVWLMFAQAWLVGRLSARWGEARVVELGIALMAVGLVALAWAPNPTLLLGVAAVIAVGNGLTLPALASLYSKACAEEKVGELLGQSQSMATTGRIVGPMWAGAAMGSVGLGAPFWIAGLLMAIGLLLFRLRHRRPQ